MTEAFDGTDGEGASFDLGVVLVTLEGMDVGSTSLGFSGGAAILGGSGGWMTLVTEDAGSGLERLGEAVCDGARLGAGSSINMPLIGSNR